MASAETFRLNSPDGKIEALVSDGKTLTLDVSADGKKLLEKVEFAMDTDRGALGKDASAVSCDYSNHRGAIDTVWGIEKSVRDDYNQMELNFKKFKVIVRAYDDAVAYRFVSKLGDGKMTVRGETLNIPLKSSDKLVAHLEKGVQTSFEKPYTRLTFGEMKRRIRTARRCRFSWTGEARKSRSWSPTFRVIRRSGLPPAKTEWCPKFPNIPRRSRSRFTTATPPSLRTI